MWWNPEDQGGGGFISILTNLKLTDKKIYTDIFDFSISLLTKKRSNSNDLPTISVKITDNLQIYRPKNKYTYISYVYNTSIDEKNMGPTVVIQRTTQ